MDKYLIINADDFGMCRAANLAVMDLLKSGSITSSTIMLPARGHMKHASLQRRIRSSPSACI